MNWTVLYSMIRKLSAKVNSLENLSPFSYKGSVETKADLPAKATKGAMYTVKSENNAEYVWSGTEWVSIGEDSTALRNDVNELKSLGLVKKNGVLCVRHRKEN